MHVKTAGLAALACLASAALGAVGAAWYFGRDRPEAGAVVSTLRSAVLAEDRELIVHLPESYEREQDRRYPVVYVLDGSSQDGPTARSAALLARLDLMPEVICVGLPNAGAGGRERDYTPPFMRQDADDPRSPMGQGDRFLEFVKTEVIPDIDRRFRTTGVRMLAGHSRGGLLVVYSLTRDPALFDARFAHSPALWRDAAAMVAHLEAFLASHAVAGSLYLSLGGAEVERMATSFDRVRDVLAAKAPPTLRWRADRIPGANHQQNPEWATPVGFHWLYRQGQQK